MNVIEYATAFTREDGLKDFTDILAANKQIDAVYSLDDETSIGALQAIEDAGRTDIKVITGGGGCQEYFKIIKENEIHQHLLRAVQPADGASGRGYGDFRAQGRDG